MLADRPVLAACSWLSLLLAFACSYAAAPQRRPRGLTHHALSARSLRVFALCLFVLGFACRAQLETAAAAAVVVLSESALIGSLFACLTPLYPRTVWAIAFASVPLLVTCVWWEVLRG